MNKSILKHELRSMKWMMLLSILASLFLTAMFSRSLDRQYASIFYLGIYDDAFILSSFRDLAEMALIVFTGITMIQVFMQFRSEKSPETGRFLKSLPVRKEEFFKIKLITGLVSISLAFIVLSLGLIIIRSDNMFWIEDIYSISYMPETLIKVESVGLLLRELGLIYLIVLSFYTFLFMIQYTFTNVVGAIVTGVLVWLAPIFILISSMFTLERIRLIDIYTSKLAGSIDKFSTWLLPWVYALDFNFIDNFSDMSSRSIRTIAALDIKYLVTILLIIVNIGLAYKFNKSSKVENENKLIVFKTSQKIFVFGVTICSGLLISLILSSYMMLEISNIVYVILILLAGLIGYFISRRISRIGNI